MTKLTPGQLEQLRFNNKLGSLRFNAWTADDFQDHETALLDHIDALQAEVKQQWQPIETAPKDGTVVILGSTVMEESSTGRWYIPGGAWWDFGVQNFRTSDIFTHWMPLPEPPRRA